ncbi:MAG TPA: hypothetical protein VNT75_09470 [Symbiobacteriaceae bacterium]|nr:hypothetical protein [Symbiobacteriaceae bacterium]
MAVLEKNLAPAKTPRRITTIEWVGLALVVLAMIGLFFGSQAIAGTFDAMVNKVVGVIVKLFITGSVGMAIIVSVMTGRVLERLGFTDALIRIFVPIAKWLNINPAVIIPGVYNILGDINAAGRITGPILKKSGATKDEQKIAVATMVQSEQSFSTFMLGILAMSIAGVKVFPVVILAVFVPLVAIPALLKLTIWRKTKAVAIDDLPKFTPNTAAIPTLFNAAREGAEVLFLIVIPAGAAVFAIIGALEYWHIWQPIERGLAQILGALSIDPTTGIVSVMASPTLAMAQLKETAANLDPRLVVGSFVLGASGLPFSVVFGQIPAIWAGSSDLNEREAMGAAILGIVMRILTAFLIGALVTPLVI